MATVVAAYADILRPGLAEAGGDRRGRALEGSTPASREAAAGLEV